MKREDVWQVYDSGYANDYNERYLLNPISKISMDTELGVLKKILSKESRWLDLGCGTGYFLSCFPGIPRAGLDLSPEMIKSAKEVNPDILFIQQGDYRDAVAEWNGAWTLVSCMWAAYSYVESVKDVEQLVKNMIDWTAEGGAIFIPIIDIEDVRPNMVIPYEEKASVFGGVISITSVSWTWLEEGGQKLHEHLVAPHVEHFIKLLGPFFDQVEIIRYPPYQTGWVSRKAVLATGKRDKANHHLPARLILQSIPAPVIVTEKTFHNPLSAVSYKILILELLRRMKSKILRK